MASRGDIEAGKAHVLLYLKNTLTGGLKAAQKQLEGIGQGVMKVGVGLSAAGSAIVGPMMAAVKQFADMGSVLADMSAKTGMAAGSLAELKFAAEQSGASLDDVEKAILMMQKKGISGTFDEVAAKIAAIQDPAKRTQAAFENWGKGGAALLPMIENLQALRQEARELGLVPTEEAVGMADAIGDAFDKVNSVLSATVFEIGAALAPVLMPALEVVKGILVGVSRWVRQNGDLVRTVFIVGSALLAAGAAVTAIGATLIGVGTVLGAIATVIGAILSPIGLVITAVIAVGAAIAGAAYYFFRFTEAGKRAAQAIASHFAPLFAVFKTMLGGILDALAGGDLELAGKIAMQGLIVVFEAFRMDALRVWLAIKESFMRMWEAMLLEAARAVGYIGGVMNELGINIIPSWDSIVEAFRIGWENIGSVASGVISGIAAGLKQMTDILGMVIGGLSEAADKASQLPGGSGAKLMPKGMFLGIDLSNLDAAGIAGADAAGAGVEGDNNAARAVRRAEYLDAIAKQQARLGRAITDLDDLRDEAAKKRAALNNATLPGVGLGGSSSEIAKQTFVTFSAQAAVMQGQGGNPLLITAREANRIQKETVAAIRALQAAMIPLLGVI